LGGSFNPAHGGHLHISRLALARLGVDEVWWLVSPQNPLKSSQGMALLADRLAGARHVAAADRRIRVTDIEARLGSRYTVDTLRRLRRRYPRLAFVWLMGSDILAQLPRWRGWAEIFRLVPIAVFDRPSYSLRALSGPAARRFARHRLPEAAARALAGAPPPAWAFFHTRLDVRSATEIRSRRQLALSPSHQEPGAALTSLALSPAMRRRRRRRTRPQPGLLDLVSQTLEDGKAEDIVAIELAGKTVIADYMVIATGRSARQVTALTERLEQALAPHVSVSVEGKAQGDWVLLDAGDVIIHLFHPEVRAYYNLEKMWGADFSEPEALRQ
jgi:nicotinate (nicotinamide) nucleotide adenylyltransferase/ribosome silencing factor RsfS/YbeB/iojap